MKAERMEFDGWQLDRPINVEIAGNVVTLTQTERPVRKPQIEWLDDESYINLATGEIKQKQHAKTRGDAMAAAEVRRTLKRMRGLINANFTGDRNELFLTLTYRENMQDTKRLYRDLKNFTAKMGRKLGEIKYLTAVEPQERGAWHAHCLFKQLTAHATYMPAEELAALWGHGFIHVTRLKDADNVGAYLSAYLTNTPADDDTAAAADNGVSAIGERAPKAVVKGGRLHMYPKGCHIYRASRNLEQPIIKKIRPGSAEHRALVNSGSIVYTSKLELSDNGTDGAAPRLINRISQMQINRKR